MSGISALDVVIGLVFIYLIYSLLATLIQEIIATNLGFRAKLLRKAISRMLDEESDENAFMSRMFSWLSILFFQKKNVNNFSEYFYKHPLIKYLGEDKWHSKPSYLSAKNFSKIIIDLLRTNNIKTGEDFKNKIEESLNDPEKSNLPLKGESLQHLKSLWIDAQGDVEKFKALLEQWFDDMMERTTGWYKKYTQIILFIIGFIIAMTFNVDTILIVKKLSKDPVLRAQIVQQASGYLKEHPTLLAELEASKKRVDDELNKSSSKTKLDSLNAKDAKAAYDSIYKAKIAKIDTLQKTADTLIKNDIANINGALGLGWVKDPKCKDCRICLPKPAGNNRWFFIGWLLTALAISMGAPFWFDLLNKLMKLKGSIGKDDSSSDKKDSNEPAITQRKG